MAKYLLLLTLLCGCTAGFHEERIAVIGFYALNDLAEQCKAVCLGSPAQVVIKKRYITYDRGQGSKCEVFADCICSSEHRSRGDKSFTASINFSMYDNSDYNTGIFGASDLCKKSNIE